MKNTEWGGHMEIQAMSLLYRHNVQIYRVGEPRWDIVNFPSSAPIIRLSYVPISQLASGVCTCTHPVNSFVPCCINQATTAMSTMASCTPPTPRDRCRLRP